MWSWNPTWSNGCERYGKELLVIIHPHAKFEGHRQRDSEDMNIPPNTIIIPQMRDLMFVGYPWMYLSLLFSPDHVAFHLPHVLRLTT